MKWFGIIAMILLMTMTGCKNEMGTQDRGCFENDDAVSLKDIIKIYDKYASAKEDSTDFDLFAAFYGQDAADNVLEYEIVRIRHSPCNCRNMPQAIIRFFPMRRYSTTLAYWLSMYGAITSCG